jgi:hypothetical protein
MLINKHDITSSCDLNSKKEVPFVLHYQLPLSSVPCTWDPGIHLFQTSNIKAAPCSLDSTFCYNYSPAIT